MNEEFTPEDMPILELDLSNQQADDRAALVKDAIELCVLKGAGSLQAVANCLIERNIPTARGGQWSPTAVMRVMQRLGLELTKTASTPVSL
ncbi:recombinase family protein [Pseudomonas sp. SMV7]|uniref:recombinase family protein n=1 Tax=Pseudomonas sp. SMV7 TaxID=3390194 RepID=UPI003F84F00A